MLVSNCAAFQDDSTAKSTRLSLDQMTEVKSSHCDRLMADCLVNNIAPMVASVAGLILVPMMLKHLGEVSYALWIAAFSVAGTVGLLDFGLPVTIIRCVSEEENEGRLTDSSKAVSAAGQTYAALGLMGAVLIATLGLPIASHLHLTERLSTDASVFGLVGVAFVGDVLTAFGVAVLTGLRRFGIVHLLLSSSTVVKTVVMVVMLHVGIPMLGIATWYAAGSIFTAIIALVTVDRIRPRFNINLKKLHWMSLTQLKFGVLSQFANGLQTILWQGTPVIVGFFLGPGAVVLYYISQRVPLLIWNISWRAGDAVLPTAARVNDEERQKSGAELLAVGTRWITLFALPLSIVVWIISPLLLLVWVKTSSNAAVVLTRLTVLAAFVCSFGATSMKLLWGRGEVNHVFKASLVSVVCNAVLLMIFVKTYGLVAAGWALFLSNLIGYLLLVAIAVNKCGMSLVKFLRLTAQGLVLASVVCAAVCSTVTYYLRPVTWPGLFFVGLVSCAAFGIVFLLIGAKREEVAVWANAVKVLLNAIRYGALRARIILREIRILRSGWCMLVASWRILRTTPDEVHKELEDDYQIEDPWKYDTDCGTHRLGRLAEIVKQLAGRRRIGEAIDIGCGDGRVTEVLAKFCGSVDAVDVCRTALYKASTRCRAVRNAYFYHWDLKRDPLRKRYDLVCVMGVLEAYFGPRELRDACKKIIELVNDDGYLFVNVRKDDELVEEALWARALMRGSRAIIRFIGRQPLLEPTMSMDVNGFAVAVFRKRPRKQSVRLGR